MQNSIPKLTIIFIVTLSSLLLRCHEKPLSVFAENGGHRAVTSSLREGFFQLKCPYYYNRRGTADCVLVLSGINNLQQAINMKRSGQIKKLLAGPNVITRSDEYQGLIASPEVDICIVPSDWVRVAYEEETPSLKGRIKTWFAGVDHQYWQPTPTNEIKKQVLIYWKTESAAFCKQIEAVIKRYDLIPICIKFGHYSHEQYKALLDQVLCAVFISVSESQGIALAEAWSMNVPTLVWNSEQLTAHGRVYSVVSSAPYLCSQTGAFWKTLDDLDALLKNLSKLLAECNPREWILNNCTHIHTTQKLLEIMRH